MAVDILVTTERLQEDPLGRDLIEFLKASESAITTSPSALYYDFPVYSDYDGIDHKPDILILSQNCGIIAIRVITEVQAERDNVNSLLATDESLNQFCSILIGRLLKSKALRKSRAQLSISVTPVIFCDSNLAGKIFDQSDSEIISSTDSLRDLIQE